MTKEELNDLTALVSKTVGLRLVPAQGKNATGEYVDFGCAELEKNEGFGVHVQLGWRTIEVQFVPGTYAAPLLLEMGTAAAERAATIASFASYCSKRGAVLI
jgi:hypothetical protein